MKWQEVFDLHRSTVLSPTLETRSHRAERRDKVAEASTLQGLFDVNGGGAV